MSPFAIETLPPGNAGRAGVTGSAPPILAEIGRRDVNLAVWARSLPPDLAPALRHVAEAGPFVAVAEDAPDHVADAIADGCPAPLPAALLHDMRALAVLFSLLVGRPDSVRLRLEAFDGPGCWRWHADAVGLRLLCTYHGPGTELYGLAAGAEAARRLGPRIRGTRLGPGAVAVLKGEGFPGNAGGGCIHRAPQNAGPRLLLCLDEPGRIPLE